MPPEQVQTEIAQRYRLRSEIGSGGMGTVWDAEDSLLKRDVAVKEIELPRAVGADEREAIRKRVLREARAAAALNHANAVTVFDVIEEDGKAFIVMERITGSTLDQTVRNEGPLSDERLIQIADDVLSALEVAHGAGIVHRDVKPANVMLTDDGRTKLADFGIASVKDDPKITASGLILGSPSYMAPEQATHGRSGPEADLWGLGATLYFALEGVAPFDGQGPIPTLTAVVGDEPRPFQRSSKLIPVVEALLRKDPTQRPSATEVRDMLQAAAGGAPATMQAGPPSTSRLEQAPRPTQAATYAQPAHATTESETDRRPWLWLAGLAAAVLAGVLIAMFVSGGDEQVAESEPKQKKEAPAAKADESAEEPAEEPVDTSADTGTAVVPEGWTTYEDPTIGYTIAHPADWSVEARDEQNTFFSSPDGAFLQIGWRSPPDEAGPVGAWEEFEPSFASRQEGYQRVGAIRATEFKGMEAGWWEMTYEGLHAVNLGFITPTGEYGMALFFNTPEEEWEDSQEVFEQLQASFQPPA